MKYKQRNLEFIPQEVLDKLPKKDYQLLLNHRKQYRLIRIREEKIKRDEKKLGVLKEELKEMKINLNSLTMLTEHLRKKFHFSCSFSPLPPRGKNNIVYYNLCINRHDKRTIGMGTEKSIKELLGNHYKNNISKMILLKKDWKQFIINETNYREINGRKIYGETYLRISKMIVKHGTNFEKIQVDRNTLFPTKVKRGK